MFAAIPLHAADLSAATAVADLRCEDDSAPLGIDAAEPRLSWRLETDRRGAAQVAYRVVAATSADRLAANQDDLWDSGRRDSPDQAVPYAGRAPATGSTVFWKVQVWDETGAAAWSAPATWTAGVMRPQDWAGARWITDPDLLRLRRRWIGFRSPDSEQDDVVRWVQIDLGRAAPVDGVFLHGLHYGVVDGAGFPIRFRIELAATPDFSASRILADYTGKDFPNRWTNDLALAANGAVGRYLRVTATRLRREEGRCFLGFSHVEVRRDGRDLAAGAAVTASASVENAAWSGRALTDELGAPDANPRGNGTLRLQKDLAVAPGLVRAIVHVCGEGEYVLRVNGRRAGEDLFAPGWTHADRTCLYDTRDLTALLGPGPNRLELTLAGGMYNVQPSRLSRFVTPMNPLTAIALVQLTYADGRSEEVVTDGTWRVVRSPTTFANVYGGEDYDARLAAGGAGANAVTWAGPGGVLRGHSFAGLPIRGFERFRARAVGTPRPGVAVYDLGQNAAMAFHFVARGPAGSALRIVPSELLDAEGLADSRSSGGVAWCTFTLSGAGTEEWSPDFFYRGCRYLQVESRPAPGGGPGAELLEAETRAVHAAAAAAGEFACSHELFNRIHTLIGWAQRSNLASVITDCPHRERLGWLEQLHLNGPSLRYNYALRPLFAKAIRDMVDSQQEDGLVPDTAPDFSRLTGGYRDSPEWGSACILVPWQEYEFSGETALLRAAYPMMIRYLGYLGSRARSGIVDYGLGDWYDLGPQPPGVAQLTPVALTATAFYAADAAIVARAAGLLGRPDEARRYGELARSVRAAFNAAFLDPRRGAYATDSQCADALPLALDLVPPEQREGVERALAAAILRDGSAITAGDVGYRFVLRALGDAGRSDLVYALNDRMDRPGYGYQLRQGATSLTEAWDAGPASSQDHFMLGQIEEWFYRDLAGIQSDPARPGFRHFIVKPSFLPGIAWVRGAYRSEQGWIRVRWEKAGAGGQIEIEVPPNASATVIAGAVRTEVPAGRYRWSL